jgi:hypothetical protein
MKTYKKLKLIKEISERLNNTELTLKSVKKLSTGTPEQIIRENSLYYTIKRLLNIRAAEFSDPMELKPLDFEKEFQLVIVDYLERSIVRDMESLKKVLNSNT